MKQIKQKIERKILHTDNLDEKMMNETVLASTNGFVCEPLLVEGKTR